MFKTSLLPTEISIHSPYTGRDRRCPIFLRATEYFNPLSLYRERQCRIERRRHLGEISIHSPYTGRDV